jgi:hypothetical protein
MAQPESPELAAALVPYQLKLYSYNEEELAIWFHLIEAQFATMGIKSEKIKYANDLANLP